MQPFLITLSIIIFGFALRSCRTSILRKLGALVMLYASGLCFYYITGSVLAGIAGALAWFLLPWIEILTRIRTMRMPLENKLEESFKTNISHYPNASEHIRTLMSEGFEHIRNCEWNLGGMNQLYQLYWNAETKTVATLCLCEQSNITFTYLTLTSRDIIDGIWRTTNFPFSSTLMPAPRVHYNQVSCSNECAKKLLQDHDYFLYKQGFLDDDLNIPNPDELEKEIEMELKNQIEFNIEKGIIKPTGDGYFNYTLKGYFFLWRQFIKDMIRLC